MKILGKVYGFDALGEVRRGNENVEYACGIGEVIKGEYNKNISTEVDSWSEFVPLGTVLGITPFNFPANGTNVDVSFSPSNRKFFILKPSEKGPLGSMFITELFNKTKAPKGLLNLVNGDKKTVEALISDKRIKAVSFVGSTPLQKRFMNYPQFQAECQALGGAKNHALILSDANIDYTTDQLISAAFGSSGQRCMALSVAVVSAEIKNKFLKSLKEKVLKLKFGSEDLNSNSFGPLVTLEHLKSVENNIKIAEEEGAEIIIDGRDLFNEKNSKSGYFLGPTIIDKVNSNMQSYKNEIFGPVLQIMEMNMSYQKVSKIINQNKFSNSLLYFHQ